MMPITWKPTTEEWYWYSLEVLPPEYMGKQGSFLVGEPVDHRTCEITGQTAPTWAGYREPSKGVFEATSRSVTRNEFIKLLASEEVAS